MTNYFEGDITYDDDGSTYGHASNISKCTDLMNIKKYDKQSMLINNRLLSGVGCEFKVLNPLNNTKEQWYMRLNKALHTPYAEPQYLCLEGNDIQYWIADGVEFLGNLTGIYLKENQAAMLNMLLPKVPKEFQDIFGWQLVRVTPPPRDLVLLDLHYGSVDLSLKASLAMEKSSCLQVINHQAFKKPKPGPLPQALTIKTVVTLGSISLGMLECSQLEIGDLLFLQDSNFDEQGSGILSVGPLHLFVTIELINDQYQLAINRWGRNMSQTDTHPEDEELISDDMELTPGDGEDNSGQNEGDRQDSLPVGDLPINIDVRLGSITFTVQDLNNLVEGKLYTINSPGKGLVQLTHNDMELARGQLVEVDGKLAIEIQKALVALVTGESFEPYPLILLLASLSILPFLLVVTTSFLKISMVLMIVRNAMGIQQVPPNMVLYGISLALTLFIMAPTIQQVNNKIDDLSLEDQSVNAILDNVSEVSIPVREFMVKQNHPDVQMMMMETAKALWPKEMYEGITKENFLILVPSFVVSELQKGLQIGFLIYVPFIIVDLLVSNILLALGMQMVSPMTISLPLKILLFVLVEGWAKLLQSLALSYV